MLQGPLGRGIAAQLSSDDYDFKSAAALDLPAFVRDAPLASYPAVNDDVTRALRQTLQLLAARQLQNAYWTLSHTIEQFCATPAQAMLMLGLASLGMNKVVVKGHEGVESVLVPREAGGDDTMILTPKAGLDGYRAAFLVEVRREVPDFDHPVRPKRGARIDASIPGVKRESLKMLIECESPKQDATDISAQGDRLLASLGFPVMRFSEARIWEDPIDCALEIFWSLQGPQK